MYRHLAIKVFVSCVLACVCTTLALGSGTMNLYRTYFQCPRCDKAALEKCPVPTLCKEIIKEPGICACCFTCARMEGEGCGVFTQRCASGLKCEPPITNNPFNKLMLGKGICVRPQDPLYEGNILIFYSFPR